jgi:hypothetical protein
VAAPFSQDKQSQILEFFETTTGCAIFRETALLAFLRARKGADVKSSSMMFRGTKKKKTQTERHSSLRLFYELRAHQRVIGRERQGGKRRVVHELTLARVIPRNDPHVERPEPKHDVVLGVFIRRRRRRAFRETHRFVQLRL